MIKKMTTLGDIGYSGPIQAPIPAQFRHLFRLNSGSHSAQFGHPLNV
jgi:hypothetical protein